MKLVQSFTVDETTAVYLTETKLTDGSVAPGVRILQRELLAPETFGDKTIDIHFHCGGIDIAMKIYEAIQTDVVEIENLMELGYSIRELPMKYWRQDKGDGSVEEVTREEVRRALEGNYKNVDVVMGEIQLGNPVATPFAIYTNYKPTS
jgi:hypothetical protein